MEGLRKELKWPPVDLRGVQRVAKRFREVSLSSHGEVSNHVLEVLGGQVVPKGFKGFKVFQGGCRNFREVSGMFRGILGPV